MTYVSGDFWRICDVCGFKYRRSQTSKRWDGLMVCREDYEERHPQDYVRGRLDHQNVPEPRPEPADDIIGPLTTSISVAATASATTVSVDSSTGFIAAHTIGIALNDGNVRRYTVQSVPTSTSITFTPALGGAVSVGNAVIDYSSVALADIG